MAQADYVTLPKEHSVQRETHIKMNDVDYGTLRLETKKDNSSPKDLYTVKLVIVQKYGKRSISILIFFIFFATLYIVHPHLFSELPNFLQTATFSGEDTLADIYNNSSDEKRDMLDRLETDLFVPSYWNNRRKRFVTGLLMDPSDIKTFTDCNHPEKLKHALTDLANEFINDSDSSENFSLLLYGPPGTGKTQLVKWLFHNHMNNVSMFYLSPGLFHDNDVEGVVSQVSDLFDAARTLSPSVVFIDEADQLLKKRHDNSLFDGDWTSLTSSLIAEIDGFKSRGQVMVIGATNYPFEMDDAALRRFEYITLIDKPSWESRKSIILFHIHQQYETTKGANTVHELVSEDTLNKLENVTEDISRNDLDSFMVQYFKSAQIKKALKDNSSVFNEKHFLKFMKLKCRGKKDEPGIILDMNHQNYDFLLKEFVSSNVKDLLLDWDNDSITEEQ